jgi:hypothetical protein
MLPAALSVVPLVPPARRARCLAPGLGIAVRAGGVMNDASPRARARAGLGLEAWGCLLMG